MLRGLRRCVAWRGMRRPLTTLVGAHFPAFDPDDVIAKHYDRWQQDPTHKYHGMSKEEIKELWKRSREEAAAAGKRLHAAIKSYYNGTEIDYDVERPEWKHFLAFQKEYNLTAHRTEMAVWSDEHKLGGKIDLVAKNSDGTYSIYDWKRCNGPIWKEERHYSKYGRGTLSEVKNNKYYQSSMQLNMYRELLERNHGYKVKSMHIVRLHPSAESFEVTDVERMEAEMSGALQKRQDDNVAESALNKPNDFAIFIVPRYMTLFRMIEDQRCESVRA